MWEPIRFCFTCFSLIHFSDIYINAKNKYNHIMRTKCASDMKQTAFEREFYKLSLYTKNNFDLCPVPHAFARMPHKYAHC